ncbi:hypothetical protein N7522_010671 [Penicillium canescens]|nr:hypothetical protein N7522_010671 [Penicillium canescens]
MFKKFCGKVKCLGRLGRMCNCDDEEANTEGLSQSNRPSQSTHQNQDNGQRQAILQNQTEENQQTEENEEGENYPPLPPSRTSSNTSSTGLTHAVNEANLSGRGSNNQADPMDEDNGKDPQEGGNSPRPSISSKRKRWCLQEEEDPEYVEGQQGSSSHSGGSGLSRPSKRARSNPPSPVHRSPLPIASSSRDQVPYWSWSRGTSREGSPRPKAPRPDSPSPTPQPEALRPDSHCPVPRKPTKEKIAKYRELGANFQAWIDDPNKPDCPIGRSWLTLDELEKVGTRNTTWPRTIPWNSKAATPRAQIYPEVRISIAIRAFGGFTFTRINQKMKMRGAVMNILLDGESSLAKALYTNDYSIDTLRHVMFTNVINEGLAPYIEEVLYPRKGTLWSDAWEVPSAFTRGTMCVTQIVVWSYNGSAQIRFEIEPNVPDPTALPAAAGLGSI